MQGHESFPSPDEVGHTENFKSWRQSIWPHFSTDDNEQSRRVLLRFVGGSRFLSGPKQSFSISRPVSLEHFKIYVTPFPPPRGPGFILLGGSPYWSSPSRSYLVRCSILSSNQSNLSCLPSPNLLSSILIYNISCSSLFVIPHSPFMYFCLSEFGVLKFVLHFSVYYYNRSHVLYIVKWVFVVFLICPSIYFHPGMQSRQHSWCFS